jgi:hypothetical protein
MAAAALSLAVGVGALMRVLAGPPSRARPRAHLARALVVQLIVAAAVCGYVLGAHDGQAAIVAAGAALAGLAGLVVLALRGFPDDGRGGGRRDPLDPDPGAEPGGPPPADDVERAGAASASAGAPPHADDLAHRRLPVGDARVQRPDAEVEAPGLGLLELDHDGVKAPALLVDLDDVARGDALGAAPRRRLRAGLGEECRLGHRGAR